MENPFLPVTYWEKISWWLQRCQSNIFFSLGHRDALGICPLRRVPEFLSNHQSKSVRKGKPSREMDKVLRKHFSKEVQKVNKHIKRCSTSGKCKVKLKWNTIKHWSDWQCLSTPMGLISYTAGGKENWHNHFKNQLAFSSKFEYTHKQWLSYCTPRALMHMCP